MPRGLSEESQAEERPQNERYNQIKQADENRKNSREDQYDLSRTDKVFARGPRNPRKFAAHFTCKCAYFFPHPPV